MDSKISAPRGMHPWTQVRDKWCDLDDSCRYSYLGQPHGAKLKDWKGSWTSEEKHFLVKNYAALSKISPSSYGLQNVQRELKGLFFQYFSPETAEMDDFFSQNELVFLNLVQAVTEIRERELLDLRNLFQKYGKSGSYRPKVSLNFFLDKLIEEVADHLIGFRVKQASDKLLKNNKPQQQEYLSQGLISHTDLFQSYHIQPVKKKKTKLSQPKKDHWKGDKKHHIPSWMILGYIKGLYSDQTIQLEEREVKKMALVPQIEQRLINYMKRHQTTTIQHFKRLILSQYFDVLDRDTLENAQWGDDQNTRHLFPQDIERVQRFYEKWKEYSGFDESKFAQDPSKLIRQKVYVYLQYYGFHIEFDGDKQISIFSWLSGSRPNIEFNFDVDGNSFLSGLGSNLASGYQVAKKYAPIVGTILLTAAALLGDKVESIEESDALLYDFTSGDRCLETGTLTDKKAKAQKKRYKQTPHLESQNGPERAPQGMRAESDLETVIARHLAEYAHSMIADKLADPEVESLVQLTEKLPWIDNLTDALEEKWTEYHYKLFVENPTVLWKESDSNARFAQPSDALAQALQCQTSWAQRLMQSFHIKESDLEQARAQLIKGQLQRLKKGALDIDGWETWLNSAQSCWATSAQNYLLEWEKNTDQVLSLPHINRANLQTVKFSKLIAESLEKRGYLSAQSILRTLSAPVFMWYLDVFPNTALLGRDIMWIDYALAYRVDEITQKYIKQQMEMLPQQHAPYVFDTHLQDHKAFFAKALAYGIPMEHLLEYMKFLMLWMKEEFREKSLYFLAQMTTAEQFSTLVSAMQLQEGEHHSGDFLQENVAQLFLNWHQLSPTQRDEQKILSVIRFTQPLDSEQLKKLICTCSEQTLCRLAQENLILPTALSKTENDHDSKAAKELALLACRHGFYDFAKIFLEHIDQNEQTSDLMIFWKIMAAMGNPRMIDENKGISNEAIYPWQIQNLPEKYLRALLMRSARMTVIPLAKIITGTQSADQLLGSERMPLLLKQLFLSSSPAYKKQQYLCWLIESLGHKKTFELITYWEAAQKELLSDKILELQNVPKNQRYATQKVDQLMSQIISLVLDSTQYPIVSQPSGLRVNVGDVERQLKHRNKQKTVFLSQEFLEEMIEKRWLKSIQTLMHKQKNGPVEKWLPLSPRAEQSLKQTSYYRQFEEYMSMLIENNILSQSPHKALEKVYRYWNQNCYAPSEKFALRVLTQAPTEQIKTLWLKILLKLSARYDSNPKRRQSYWETCLGCHYPEKLKVHHKSLDTWIQQSSSHDVIQAYLRLRGQDIQTKLQQKFPFELSQLRPESWLRKYGTKPLQSCFAPILPASDPLIVQGCHVQLLRVYLLEHFRHALESPSSYLRQSTRHIMGELMRGWYDRYQTTLYSDKDSDGCDGRSAIKEKKKKDKLEWSKRKVIGEKPRSEDSFLTENHATLCQYGLVFTDSLAAVQHIQNEIAWQKVPESSGELFCYEPLVFTSSASDINKTKKEKSCTR